MTELTTDRLSARLAELVREARTHGASLDRLGAIIDIASEHGAMRALHRCGLADEGAGDDIRELRDLLEAWRDTKKTARRTVVRWLIRGLLTALGIGVAIKLKLFGG